MQTQIKKKKTYNLGIMTLFDLRNQLMETLISLKEELNREDFSAIPFINAKGYHNKNIAYSIWHIFRIEDIVVHTLIHENEQVFLQVIIKNVFIHRLLQPVMNLLKRALLIFQNNSI